jgi:hypothetical protein
MRCAEMTTQQMRDNAMGSDKHGIAYSILTLELLHDQLGITKVLDGVRF